MTPSNTKPKTTLITSQPISAPITISEPPSGSHRPGTKQDAVLALLKHPEGTTISAIMDATGWQSHSVRGFFAGVVRKKLGLTLRSDVADGHRVYRITTKSARIRVRTKKADAASAAQP